MRKKSREMITIKTRDRRMGRGIIARSIMSRRIDSEYRVFFRRVRDMEQGREMDISKYIR